MREMGARDVLIIAAIIAAAITSKRTLMAGAMMSSYPT
jgi:hypothetical protein